MRSQIKAISASVLALCAASGAFAQVSQSPPAAAADATSETGMQDIVVTATRQATNLQDTPLAITAVTSANLAQRSITNTADLGAIVPNATFRPAQGAYGPSVTAFIRGIGQGDGSLASEPGVAFYADDVYYPLVLGSLFDLLDLDHVEVLRGPQGTLFGRNALAGAVNLVSKAPDLHDPSGYIEATYGQYNRINVRAGFNLPLSDTLAVRVSGVAKKMTGYQKRLDFRCQMVKNGTPQLAGNFPYSDGNLIATVGNNPNSCVTGYNGGEDVKATRAQLLWEPIPTLKITVTGDYTKDESSVTPDSLLSVNATTAAANPNTAAITNYFGIAYDSRFVTGNPYTTYATYRDPVPGGTVIPGSTFWNGSATRGGFNYNPVNPVTQWGVSTKGVYNITPHIDATVILAYRDVTAGYTYDVDASPLPLETTHNLTTHKQYTAEGRLSGKSSFIDWTAGVFYYRAHEDAHLFVESPWLSLERIQNNKYEPESKSAYANVTIHPFTDRLGITGGIRYSDDKKPVAYNNIQDGVPSGNIIFGVTPKDSRFDWKAGIDYKLTDHTLLYASAATGFRLPSFNARPLQPDQVYQIPGDNIIAYEAGIKTDLFDHKLRINATGFYTDYKERPTSISGQELEIDSGTGQPISGNSILIALAGGPPGSTTCRARTAAEIAAGTPGFTCLSRSFVTNTPGKIKGGELEIEAHPIPHLTINFSGGYSRFTAPDLEIPTRATDRVLGIPEWNGSGGVQYDLAVPSLNGSISPRVDWFYQGSIAYSAISTAYKQSPYSTFNGRLTYYNEKLDATLSLSVTNMFNKFYYYNYFVYTELGYSNVNAQPARPRMWAVTIGKKF